MYDIVIIGGGPAGLSCAIYASRGNLSTIILDRASTAGALAYASKIANYPGLRESLTGAELLNIMREQALGFGAIYRKTAVQAVDFNSDPRVVYTTDGIYSARAIVIATGSRGRAEKIEGEEEYLGKGVSYCATCDAAFYKDRVVGVVGCDEVALEEALFLARFARLVHFICPKSKLSGPANLIEEINTAQNIVVNAPLKAVRIVGEQFVTGIHVRGRGGEERIIPLDGVFMLLTGNAPITDFLNGSLELTPQGCVVVGCNCETSIPGVYAVGDVTCIHPNQAIIAAGEGVIAAMAIDRYIHGRSHVKVDYS